VKKPYSTSEPSSKTYLEMSGKVEKSCADAEKHLGDVVCVAYHNGTVYTGGADGKIKVTQI
jgi:hypothetical protein